MKHGDMEITETLLEGKMLKEKVVIQKKSSKYKSSLTCFSDSC